MNKIIVYGSVIGAAVGVAVYLIYKNKKSSPFKNQSGGNEHDEVKTTVASQEFVQEANFEEKIAEVKNASANSMQERHTEAANIMSNAFENIYKDIEPSEQEQKKTDFTFDKSAVRIDDLDSASNELDELLK